MIDDPNICSICNNPKSAMKGSFTQWVNVCRCDIASSLEEEADDKQLPQICKTCNKRIDTGREGSLTQFIFRSDKCSCKRPNIPEEKKQEEPFDKKNNHELEKGNVQTFDENISGFPYERFRPIKILGSGASSSVYLAADKILKKKVAVKMLHSMQEKQMIAFHEEAKATSILNHPSIIKIIDFGASSSEIPYMVLEFIDGISMSDKLKKVQRLDWSDCQIIFSQVLSALSYAHNKGIYHRDIKPNNIRLC